jgi:hypothetical protein
VWSVLGARGFRLPGQSTKTRRDVGDELAVRQRIEAAHREHVRRAPERDLALLIGKRAPRVVRQDAHVVR